VRVLCCMIDAVAAFVIVVVFAVFDDVVLVAVAVVIDFVVVDFVVSAVVAGTHRVNLSTRNNNLESSSLSQFSVFPCGNVDTADVRLGCKKKTNRTLPDFFFTGKIRE